MNCPHEKENSDCLEMNTFDAIVQVSPTEANIFSIDRDLNLGENRDASLGELPSESTDDPDRILPYVKRIDCASCGNEMEMTNAEIEKMNVIFKIFLVNLSDGHYYQVSSKKGYTLADRESYVNSEKEAIKLLNDNSWYECKYCHIFWFDQTVDPTEHDCEGKRTEDLKKFFNIKNDDEILGKIEVLFGDWQGWSCLVEDCGAVIGCDTGDMFDHLKTHTKDELEEVLKR